MPKKGKPRKKSGVIKPKKVRDILITLADGKYSLQLVYAKELVPRDPFAYCSTFDEMVAEFTEMAKAKNFKITSRKLNNIYSFTKH